MIWELHIEDATLTRLPVDEFEEVLDEEMATLKNQIMQQVKAARKRFEEQDGSA